MFGIMNTANFVVSFLDMVTPSVMCLIKWFLRSYVFLDMVGFLGISVRPQGQRYMQLRQAPMIESGQIVLIDILRHPQYSLQGRMGSLLRISQCQALIGQDQSHLSEKEL